MAGFLADNWYIYPWLTPRQREVVLAFSRTFCANTRFVFSPGVAESEELTWLVAANGALVGGAQRTGCFVDVRWVYLVADEVLAGDLSGDALGLSTLRLNARELVEESRQRIPGRQIAIHEFAHVLDQLFGISDSTQGLREGLDLHLDNRRRGIEDIIGGPVFEAMVEEDSNLEFFAYVSEVFFTDPHGVLDFHPPLYHDLVSIYGLDLAAQLPDLAVGTHCAGE